MAIQKQLTSDWVSEGSSQRGGVPLNCLDAPLPWLVSKLNKVPELCDEIHSILTRPYHRPASSKAGSRGRSGVEEMGVWDRGVDDGFVAAIKPRLKDCKFSSRATKTNKY